MVDSYQFIKPFSSQKWNRRDYLIRNGLGGLAYGSMLHAWKNNLKPSTQFHSLGMKRPMYQFPMKILVVGCGKVGRAIIQEFQKYNPNIVVTVATTKPKRVKELSKLADKVIVISQLFTNMENDSLLKKSIENSDAVIVADCIKIFSVHSYTRTCLRIRNLIEDIKCRKWDGMLGLVSSENAYGSVLGGERLTEESPIYPNAELQQGKEGLNIVKAGNVQWHINPYATALQIRTAENLLSGGYQPSVVLRTAGIWDEDKFLNAVLYTSGKHFSVNIKNSFFSFTTVKTIARAMVWAIQRQKCGIFNLAESGTLGLTRGLFYNKVHQLYGTSDAHSKLKNDLLEFGYFSSDSLENVVNPRDSNVVWDSDIQFNLDTLYCMDPDPFLPSSQRSNSQLICSKIINSGFF